MKNLSTNFKREVRFQGFVVNSVQKSDQNKSLDLGEREEITKHATMVDERNEALL